MDTVPTSVRTPFVVVQIGPPLLPGSSATRPVSALSVPSGLTLPAALTSAPPSGRPAIWMSAGPDSGVAASWNAGVPTSGVPKCTSARSTWVAASVSSSLLSSTGL